MEYPAVDRHKVYEKKEDKDWFRKRRRKISSFPSLLPLFSKLFTPFLHPHTSFSLVLHYFFQFI
jgi:hypothetical protein